MLHANLMMLYLYMSAGLNLHKMYVSRIRVGRNSVLLYSNYLPKLVSDIDAFTLKIPKQPICQVLAAGYTSQDGHESKKDG